MRGSGRASARCSGEVRARLGTTLGARLHARFDWVRPRGRCRAAERRQRGGPAAEPGWLQDLRRVRPMLRAAGAAAFRCVAVAKGLSVPQQAAQPAVSDAAVAAGLPAVAARHRSMPVPARESRAATFPLWPAGAQPSRRALPVSPARYWARRPRRSDRRSATGAPHCRGARDRASGGHRRWCAQ